MTLSAVSVNEKNGDKPIGLVWVLFGAEQVKLAT